MGSGTNHCLSPMEWNHLMKTVTCCVIFAILIMPIQAGAAGTSSLGVPPNSPTDRGSTEVLIREAARAADHAWEEFHRAAIEGTLASPALQAGIERQLHEVRALLMEARKAERANQISSVKSTTRKIFTITDIILQASRERKS